jgi:hypothetical protein
MAGQEEFHLSLIKRSLSLITFNGLYIVQALCYAFTGMTCSERIK